ncbi:DUF2156 domain-containing protein [Candidatus Woesearchaeota archaeon]|nr:DUF2156 domain-containing protein [Candidatus Woesearchaeota archaeon]
MRHSEKHGVRRIALSDKPIFDKAYSTLKKPLADQCFSMIYIWSSQLNMRRAEINGNLCVFADFEGSTAIWGPVIGGEKLQETTDICFSIADELNAENVPGRETKLLYLPEELAEEYSGLKGYEASHQSQDYVYNTQDLIELKGGRYRDKRNMINNFLSSYKPEVELYSAEKHKKGCLELLRAWRKQKAETTVISKELKFQFETETRIANDTVGLAGQLGLKGIVVIIDGKIQGMTFGNEVNAEMCSIIVEKTNLSIKGLPQYIYNEFVKRCWRSCKYVNAQEDMGVAYLKSTKLSYHPAFLIKSFTVKRK